MNRLTIMEKGCEVKRRNVYFSGSGSESPVNKIRHSSMTTSQPSRRSSLFAAFYDKFHARTGSLGERMFRRSETLRRVEVAKCPVSSQVFDLRNKNDGFYDDETAFRRPRSNSSDFLILRKTSRPLSVSVIGLIDKESNPYHQYMMAIETYELSRQHSKIQAVDKMLSVRQAFFIICEKRCSNLLVWDSDKEEICSIITLTDFLTFFGSELKKDEGNEVLIKDILSGNQLVSVEASSKVVQACEELLNNNVHRVTVKDELGNVIAVVNVRRVLEMLHKQHRSLPFADWLNHPIAMSNIGTWDAVNTVAASSTIFAAIQEMTAFCYSTMPIVDEKKDVIGVITKKDICSAIPKNLANIRNWMLSTTVKDILRHCRRHIFVESKDTIGCVFDTLLNGESSTAFVIHNKKAIGAISLTDFLAYVHRMPTSHIVNDNGLPTPSSSGSSSENIRTFTK